MRSRSGSFSAAEAGNCVDIVLELSSLLSSHNKDLDVFSDSSMQNKFDHI